MDEAHCVERWGSDFRPSYAKLGEVRQCLGNPPILAFTATANKKTQHCILASLGIPDAKIFVADVDRPNIALVRKIVDEPAEHLRIVAKFAAQAQGKMMIFVPTVKVGEEVRAGLQALNLDVPFYHGKLPALERNFLLDRYCGRVEPALDVIICTSAFGMGVDVPNVRVVIHWVQPASVGDYLQEFGRAGRDRQPALAVVFKAQRDTNVLEFMARKTVEATRRDRQSNAEAVQKKCGDIRDLDAMIRSKHCFRQQLVAHMTDAQPKGRLWAFRLLDMLFSQKCVTQRGAFCCDACDATKAQQLLA